MFFYSKKLLKLKCIIFMPKFSAASESRLSTCHYKLQDLFNEVVKKYDCSVIEGYRSSERQEELYRQGKSKVQAGDSKHNFSPSLAVDVAPYPIDWEDKNKFYHFVGYVRGVASQMGIEIRCGADWDGDFDLKDQTFFDLPHFELIGE